MTKTYPCKEHPNKSFGAQSTTTDPVRSTDNPRIADRLDSYPDKGAKK